VEEVAPKVEAPEERAMAEHPAPAVDS
jgi:hypothetical protein